MITNANMTLYNRKYDPETREDKWYATNIAGVHVFADYRVSESSSGIDRNRTFKVRIPVSAVCDKTYVSEDEWDRCDPNICWTLKNDDYVALGNVTCGMWNWDAAAYADVRSGTVSQVKRPADISAPNKFKIMSWGDNRFGGLKHWRIEGK